MEFVLFCCIRQSRSYICGSGPQIWKTIDGDEAAAHVSIEPRHEKTNVLVSYLV